MAESKPLIIEAPRQGISSSPHTGYGDVRNLDIFSIPGVARLNNLVSKVSGTTVTNLPHWIVKYPTDPDNFYGIDLAGVLYKSTDSGATWALVAGNTFTVTIASPAVFTATAHGLLENDIIRFKTTGALPTGLAVDTNYYVIATGLTADAFRVSTSQGGAAVNTSGTQSGTHTLLYALNTGGHGLVYFKEYLLIASRTKLHVYNIATGAWTFNWKTIDTNVFWHPMLVSKNDGKVYGGAGRYVFSLEENSGQTFAPGTAGTYTYTQQALDLPADYQISCVAELGNNVMLGTWTGSSSLLIGSVYANKVADIFPWDRSSASFGQPIQINEQGCWSMLAIGSFLYTQAGFEGKLYKSDGVGFSLIAQIPQSITGLTSGEYIIPYPGAIISYKGRIFFALAIGASGNIPGIGVYSLLETSQGTILTLEHIISTGNDGSSSVVRIGALCETARDSLLIGWRDGTSYGIDKVDASNFTTSYGGYFESLLYPVGTNKNKRTFSKIDIELANELAANEGLQIKYRVNLTDSFTLLKTYIHSGTKTTTNVIVGAVDAISDDVGIPACAKLQIRVELTGTTTSPSFLKIILT